MKELQSIVNDKIVAMVTDGTVEKAIQEQVEKTIKKSIQDALRAYGDFGKTITEKIEVALQTAGRDVDIPTYNQFIKQVVEEKFVQVLEANAIAHLSELIEGVIEPVTKEAKISELLAKIEEAWGDLAREHYHEEIKIDTEYNDDNTAIRMTIHPPEFSDDKVRATFYNFNRQQEDRWHIGYINIRGTAITGHPLNKARTYVNGVASILFKYYAMGTKFEMDTEIESIYVCD